MFLPPFIIDFLPVFFVFFFLSPFLPFAFSFAWHFVHGFWVAEQIKIQLHFCSRSILITSSFSRVYSSLQPLHPPEQKEIFYAKWQREIQMKTSIKEKLWKLCRKLVSWSRWHFLFGMFPIGSLRMAMRSSLCNATTCKTWKNSLYNTDFSICIADTQKHSKQITCRVFRVFQFVSCVYEIEKVKQRISCSFSLFLCVYFPNPVVRFSKHFSG